MKKIYILHGWAYSTEKWKPFVDELKKENLEVEMLKIPGLTAPLNEVWNIDDYVNWLYEVLRDENEPVILLGHSNGGLISLALALKYPEKVKKLILIDSTGIYHKEFLITFKRWIFMIAAKAGKKITKSKLLRQLLYKAARTHDYENAEPVVRETMKNLISVDYSQFLKKMRIPTTIIWGEEDGVTPLRDGNIMHREIKNSKLFVISGARHSPQLTNYKKVSEIVIENI